MAKLNIGDPVFARVPPWFSSKFPSDAVQFDGQVSTLYADLTKRSPTLLTQLQSSNILGGLQLVTQYKAVYAGDFLMSMMPSLISSTTGYGGKSIVQGLWGQVSFPASISADDIRDAMVQTGLNIALQAISAVPVIGRFAGLFVNIGMALAELLGANEADPAIPPLLVPWIKYSKDTDEELVQTFLVNVFAQDVDWTNIWRPALKGTWRYERAANEQGQEMPGARVFAPLDKHNEVGWTPSGLGAIPNTMRQAAPVQTIEDVRLRNLAYQGFADAKSEYERRRRYAYNAEGVYVELERPPKIIDTGAYKPAFAGIAGQMWQQVAQRGNPDMYKVRADVVRDEWQDYWGEFFEGGFAALKAAQKASDREAMWVWAALTPYICLVQQQGKKVVLGMPGIDRPHGGVLVTPRIFEPGHGPATIATRTGALYLEADLGGGRTDQVESQLFEEGQQVDMAVLDAGPPWTTKVIRSAKLVAPGTVLKGRKIYAVPWPTGEELLSYYQPPDVAITTPACNALRKRQRWCLERTLVCAYVRPVDADGRKAYAAFADDQLRKDCLELRELLLKHPARYAVNLTDVRAIDEPYAQRLQASGVNQTGFGLKLAPGEIPPLTEQGDPDPPPADDPADGLPFDQSFLDLGGGPRRKGRDDAGGSAWPYLVGGTVVVAGAAAAAYAMTRRQADPTSSRRHHLARSAVRR